MRGRRCRGGTRLHHRQPAARCSCHQGGQGVLAAKRKRSVRGGRSESRPPPVAGAQQMAEKAAHDAAGAGADPDRRSRSACFFRVTSAGHVRRPGGRARGRGRHGGGRAVKGTFPAVGFRRVERGGSSPDRLAGPAPSARRVWAASPPGTAHGWSWGCIQDGEKDSMGRAWVRWGNIAVARGGTPLGHGQGGDGACLATMHRLGGVPSAGVSSRAGAFYARRAQRATHRYWHVLFLCTASPRTEEARHRRRCVQRGLEAPSLHAAPAQVEVAQPTTSTAGLVMVEPWKHPWLPHSP
jgi:hypothetical protein